jgi:hypothetical protein
MNGPVLPDDFWIRLDERFDKVYAKLDENKNDIGSIQAKGCAHRRDDLRRIESLEGTRKIGIIGLIAALWALLKGYFPWLPPN